MSEVVGYAVGLKEIGPGGGEEGFVLFSPVDNHASQLRFEFPLPRWSTETHTFITIWGMFTPILENAVRLTMFPVFGERNAVGVVLKREYQAKLQYLSSTLVA